MKTKALPAPSQLCALDSPCEQAQAHDLLDADGTAEVDGLPVPVLDALVRDWIKSHLDPDIPARRDRS